MRDGSDEAFRTRAAILIAVLAMLLAITGLGGSNAAEDAVNYNVLASDTWAFFQAKNIRQTDYEIAVADLELTLARDDVLLSPEARRAGSAHRRVRSDHCALRQRARSGGPGQPSQG